MTTPFEPEFTTEHLDFEKMNGLLPVVIQDYQTLEILMVAFMNKEAYLKTLALNKVTFFSRTKNRLWTKGETSQNYLIPQSIIKDCDNDSLVIQVKALGPTCHLGTLSCFSQNFNNTLQNTLNTTEEK